jgi:hypothetical protein
MKTIIAVRLAASAILVLGGARSALAEPVPFENLSAAVDWGRLGPVNVPDEVVNVPDEVEGLVTVIRLATKQCPTDTMPTMTLDAVGRVPARWPNNVTRFSATGFDCQMSGVQCGFGPEPITTTSSEVRVYPPDDADVDRRLKLSLRCSADVRKLQ